MSATSQSEDTWGVSVADDGKHMLLDSRYYDWERNKGVKPDAFLSVVSWGTTQFGHEYEIWLMEPFWKTKKGRIITIKRLDIMHLMNILAWCARRGRELSERSDEGDGPHISIQRAVEILYEDKGWNFLYAEMKKRRPDWKLFETAPVSVNGKWRKRLRRLAIAAERFKRSVGDRFVGITKNPTTKRLTSGTQNTSAAAGWSIE